MENYEKCRCGIDKSNRHPLPQVNKNDCPVHGVKICKCGYNNHQTNKGMVCSGCGNLTSYCVCDLFKRSV